MAVLMTAHIPGATKEMIDGLRPLLGPIRTAKGFVVHTNGPVPGGGAGTGRGGAGAAAGAWGASRATARGHSRADFEAWFASSVKPTFAEGAPMPSITFDELNEVV